MLHFFDFQHLPPDLQRISRPFGELAKHIATTLPHCEETTVALQKLLESKDAAVRSAVDMWKIGERQADAVKTAVSARKRRARP